MKIQRNTLILVLAAFGLASGIYIQQRLTAPDSPSEIRSEGSEPLFEFDEADVTQFTIRRPDLTLSLEKREADDSEAELTAESTGETIADLEAETAALSQPDWALIAPEQIPASDGAVAFLLNLLATGDRRDSFTITGNGQASSDPSTPDNQSTRPSQQRLAEFGFDQPMAQVDVTLADGTDHRLILGDSNFDDSGIYAVRDLSPSSGAIEIFLVNSSLEPALLRPLEEWRYTAELPDDDVATPEADLTSPAVVDPAAIDPAAMDSEAGGETGSNALEPSDGDSALPSQDNESGDLPQSELELDP